jgi:Arc/MetJ-type ribon-helix-helix transcriptional regulator
MSEDINVTFVGPLERFIQKRTGPGGTYQSASEYIRDLVRHDYERELESQDEGLYQVLKEGAEAPLSDFVPLDIESAIQEGKARRAAR